MYYDMPPETFWRMTPYTFGLFIKAKNQRVESDNVRDKWLIWNLAAFQRMKRLPDLKRLLNPAQPQEEKKKQVHKVNGNAIFRMLDAYQAQRNRTKREGKTKR